MARNPASRGHRAWTALVAAAALATLGVAVAAPAGAVGGASPTGAVLAAAGEAVPGRYLVMLKDSVTAKSATAQTAAGLTGRYGGQVTATWQTALHGFAAAMSADQAARLAADPRVSLVQQDGYVHTDGVQQNLPSWGLDRIDQPNPSLTATGVYRYQNTAKNVHAYVIDTGIRTTHETFGGRASWGADFVDGTNTDCNGHGTHVAGTIGGSEYGVAKEISLVAVRVLGCDGTGDTATMISGVNWVAQHAIRPAVVNMSVGVYWYAPLDAAVRNAVASGVTFVVAAGNDGGDACLNSPARVTEAITVGATDRTDTRTSFSNYGSCVDIFAPGWGITSAWNTSDDAAQTISGTSMAAPHVAGVAALWLSDHPLETPAHVAAALFGAATRGVVGDAGTDSPNRMVFSLFATPAYKVAFQANTGSLWHAGSAGTGPDNLGMVSSGSPGIAQLGAGDEIAFESDAAQLWLSGPTGTANTNLRMWPSSNPAIAALGNGGYEVAFQADTGDLWLTGTAGTYDTGLQVFPGTSPSITPLRGIGNVFQVAFQGGTRTLQTFGTSGYADTHVSMAAGTSPSIASAGGGFRMAYQATDGELRTFDSSGTAAGTGLGMAAGTSPSIAAIAGDYQIAFQADTGSLWTTGAGGTLDLQLGMAAGTSPSIVAAPGGGNSPGGGYSIAFQANTNVLWLTGMTGTLNTGLGMRPGTSPSLR